MITMIKKQVIVRRYRYHTDELGESHKIVQSKLVNFYGKDKKALKEEEKRKQKLYEKGELK